MTALMVMAALMAIVGAVSVLAAIARAERRAMLVERTRVEQIRVRLARGARVPQ